MTAQPDTTKRELLSATRARHSAEHRLLNLDPESLRAVLFLEAGGRGEILAGSASAVQRSALVDLLLSSMIFEGSHQRSVAFAIASLGPRIVRLAAYDLVRYQVWADDPVDYQELLPFLLACGQADLLGAFLAALRDSERASDRSVYDAFQFDAEDDDDIPLPLRDPVGAAASAATSIGTLLRPLPPDARLKTWPRPPYVEATPAARELFHEWRAAASRVAAAHRTLRDVRRQNPDALPWAADLFQFAVDQGHDLDELALLVADGPLGWADAANVLGPDFEAHLLPRLRSIMLVNARAAHAMADSLPALLDRRGHPDQATEIRADILATIGETRAGHLVRIRND